MKPTTLLLTAITALSSFASAAGIKNHFGRNCQKGYLWYPNIAPKTCAKAIKGDHGGSSVRFQNMPTQAKVLEWYVKQGSGEPQICGAAAQRGDMAGSTAKCFNAPTGRQFGGTSWYRPASSRIKRDGVSTGEDPSAEEVCTSSVMPEAIVVDDGHMYDITPMSEDMIDQLYDLAANGTTSASIPSTYDAYKTNDAGIQDRLSEMQGDPNALRMRMPQDATDDDADVADTDDAQAKCHKKICLKNNPTDCCKGAGGLGCCQNNICHCGRATKCGLACF